MNVGQHELKEKEDGPGRRYISMFINTDCLCRMNQIRLNFGNLEITAVDAFMGRIWQI